MYWFSGPERTPLPFHSDPPLVTCFKLYCVGLLWNIKMWSSHCYLIIWPSCQLYIFYFSIFPNCQVQARMGFKLPTNWKFYGLSKAWMLFLICPKLGLQRVTLSLFFLYFRQAVKGSSLLFPFSLSSLFSFTWWVFEAWEEPFQNLNLATKLSYEHNDIESELKGFEFKFLVFLNQFCEWCALESILMGWSSIHEKSWNLGVN